MIGLVSRWGSRIIIVILWLVVTAAVALVVAQQRTSSTDTADAPNAPPVRESQRQTVALAEHSIQPVISGNGRVAHDPDGVHWMLEAPVTPESQAYQLLQAPVGVKALIVGGAGRIRLYLARPRSGRGWQRHHALPHSGQRPRRRRSARDHGAGDGGTSRCHGITGHGGCRDIG